MLIAAYKSTICNLFPKGPVKNYARNNWPLLVAVIEEGIFLISERN